jgi:hypothetical protein
MRLLERRVAGPPLHPVFRQPNHFSREIRKTPFHSRHAPSHRRRRRFRICTSFRLLLLHRRAGSQSTPPAAAVPGSACSSRSGLREVIRSFNRLSFPSPWRIIPAGAFPCPVKSGGTGSLKWPIAFCHIPDKSHFSDESPRFPASLPIINPSLPSLPRRKPRRLERLGRRSEKPAKVTPRQVVEVDFVRLRNSRDLRPDRRGVLPRSLTRWPTRT